MYKLYDFQCTICKHTFEELQSEADLLPKCPQCEQETEMMMFCNRPTAPDNPKMAEVMMKGRVIRQKIKGEIPWSKNRYSQSD